jgi:hypothetical protein
VNNAQLLAGQDNHLTINAEDRAWVEHVALASDKVKDVDVSFKPAAAKDAKDTLVLKVSLKTVQTGGYSLSIQQCGDPDRDNLPLTAYSAGIRLDAIKITVATGQPHSLAKASRMWPPLRSINRPSRPAAKVTMTARCLFRPTLGSRPATAPTL